MSQEFNMERYLNPEYEFRDDFVEKMAIRKGDEPNWTLNPRIYEEVYSEMPTNLSLEEQAIYIYCKLCTMFKYDEGYLYRDKIGKINYQSTFSKEHLESLVPGAKISCYDFSRICAKMINDIEGEIEAVIISEGSNAGHFFVGFFTNNVSAELEATKIVDNRDCSNDLTKAKNGIELRGIEKRFDKKGLLDKALKKVYPLILRKPPISIDGYIKQLKIISVPDIPDDTKTKVSSFLEVMKANKIFGNEFIQTLARVRQTDFFGTNFEYTHLGRLEEKEDGQKKYRRMALMRQKVDKQDEKNKEILYLIDSESLELSLPTKQEIIDKLNSGEFIYENSKKKIMGIDKEEI